ncbi:MAG: DUF484 family protein [Burkholderiales bacterium]|nr:DUF484 family protein [Burkholderiales bacterium]
MNADEVASYLERNPGFFEEKAELLSRIYLPHPHGGRAIALADRQVLTLREKYREMEAKFAELIRFGEENDAIGERMHRLCIALLPAPGLHEFFSVLHYNLREDFAVPHAALRVWGSARTQAGGERGEFGPCSEELKSYAAGLAQPLCGANTRTEAAAWFGEAAPHVRSTALMPLREPGAAGAEGACIGLLALGSEDAARFYPDMGTLYLKRLGEMVSAGLARFLL